MEARSEVAAESTPVPDFVSFEKSFDRALRCEHAAPAGYHLLLVQGKPLRGAEGELVARKQHVHVEAAVLEVSERLREAVAEAAGGSTAQLPIHGEALSVEAVARAIEWQSSSAAERDELLEHCSWQHLSAVLHGASWVGLTELQRVCEAKLCGQLRLENAVQLARAAQRCECGRLLSAAYYLLRAFFCYTYDEERPARADGRKEPVPRLGPTSMRHANTTVLHTACVPANASITRRAAPPRHAAPPRRASHTKGGRPY
jgi:hypothetical protein